MPLRVSSMRAYRNRILPATSLRDRPWSSFTVVAATTSPPDRTAVRAGRPAERARREIDRRGGDELHAGVAANPVRHRHGFRMHVLEAL